MDYAHQHAATPRASTKQNNNSMNETFYKKEISYINRTDKDIYVVDRTNLKILIPSYPIFNQTQEFIIRIEYVVYSDKVKLNTQLILDRMVNENKASDTVRFFHKQFNHAANDRMYNGVDFIAEYVVTVQQLEENKGAIYLDDLDTLFILANSKDCIDHPFSSEGKAKSLLGGNNLGNLGVTVNIKINDPDQKIKKKHVYFLNEVFPIEVIRSNTMREGIYISKTINGISSIVFYSLDNCNKFGFFSSHEEAMTNGNPELMTKLKIQELEIKINEERKELDLAKARLAREEAQFAQDKLVLQKEFELVKNEKDRLDIQRKIMFDEFKDRLERESSTRKESLEILKFVPAIVGGIAAVCIAVLGKDKK